MPLLKEGMPAIKQFHHPKDNSNNTITAVAAEAKMPSSIKMTPTFLLIIVHFEYTMGKRVLIVNKINTVWNKGVTESSCSASDTTKPSPRKQQ